MKKILIIMLIVCIFICPVLADTYGIEELLSSMGIMGNLDNTTVTREELAKILINASEYSSLAVPGRISPYEDVSFTSVYAPYIKLVGENSIMTAYSDGEFKPTKIVSYEEAITTILKLLGYTNNDFVAGYPASQIKISKDIGLTNGISQEVGTFVTRENLGKLIYNALNCNTKSGKTYASTLGYSTTNGNVTLSDVMTNNVEGPITYTLDNLPSIDAKVYINGVEESIDHLNKYDVIYYSDKSNTIWAYREKVTGMVEVISPNKETPTAVKISGQNYNLITLDAQKAFSINGIEVGNMATLLLDRNSNVSDAYLTEKLYQSQVGVIIAAGKKEIMSSTGKETYSYYASVLLASGEKIDLLTPNNYSSKIGYAAKITYTNGAAKIFSTRKTTEIYGKFDLTNNKLGKNKISSNISIVEFDEYGNTQLIYKNRLDGVYIDKGSVSLVTLNENNEIESIVLKDVTGDLATYGVLTSQSESKENMQKEKSTTYKFFTGKDIESYTTSDYSVKIDKGPILIDKEGNSITKIKALTKVSGQIEGINGVTLENSKGETYKISENVLIYAVKDGEYIKMTLDDALSGEYNISAYYDKPEKEGGRIRVIQLN